MGGGVRVLYDTRIEKEFPSDVEQTLLERTAENMLLA